MGLPTRFTNMAIDTLAVITASRTMTTPESGADVFCNAADLVVTLPKANDFSGSMFVVMTNVVSTATGTAVATPANGGSIIGLGATITAGSSLTNTAATDVAGDFVKVKSNGTNWYVVQSDGIWA